MLEYQLMNVRVLDRMIGRYVTPTNFKMIWIHPTQDKRNRDNCDLKINQNLIIRWWNSPYWRLFSRQLIVSTYHICNRVNCGLEIDVDNTVLWVLPPWLLPGNEHLVVFRNLSEELEFELYNLNGIHSALARQTVCHYTLLNILYWIQA